MPGPPPHKHDTVYYAVVNVLVRGQIVGAVDVWRCRICKERFCEDKRWGLTDLAPEVGLPPVPEGARWVVFACVKPEDVTWLLKPLRPGDHVEHRCKHSPVTELRVREDLTVDAGEPLEGGPEHKLALVDEYLNAEIELGYGLPMRAR